jgi:hypothetical protein
LNNDAELQIIPKKQMATLSTRELSKHPKKHEPPERARKKNEKMNNCRSFLLPGNSEIQQLERKNVMHQQVIS